MSDQKFPLVTRRQACALVRDKLGIPLRESRFDKDAMTGRAPKPVAKFGRRDLYTEESVLRYAEGLLSSAVPG